MKKSFLVLLIGTLLWQCAAFGEAVNPMQGTFEKKAVYVASDVSVSFAEHAMNTDGSKIIIHDDELVMADIANIAAHREHYRVRPPRYLVETLDDAARQAMFDRWVLEDEQFKLPFDTRVRVQNGEYGWDEFFEFFMVGDQAYEIDIDYGVNDDSPWKVMYIYELTRLKEK